MKANKHGYKTAFNTTNPQIFQSPPPVNQINHKCTAAKLKKEKWIASMRPGLTPGSNMEQIMSQKIERLEGGGRCLVNSLISESDSSKAD